MVEVRTVCFVVGTLLVMAISVYIHEIVDALFRLCMPTWAMPLWEVGAAVVKLALSIGTYCRRVSVLVCAIVDILTTPLPPYQPPYPGKAWVESAGRSMHMDKCKAVRFWCSSEKLQEALGIESRGQLLEEALVFSGHVVAFYSACVPLYVLYVKFCPKRGRAEARIGARRACCWALLHAFFVFLFFLDHLRVYDAVFRSIGRGFAWTAFDYMRYLYYNGHQTCDELLTFY